MNVTTKSGFSAEVADDVLDDIELFEDLVELDKKNLSVMPDAMLRMLGKEGKTALYNHCRTDKGRVPMSKVLEEIGEIIAGLQNGKK